MGKLTAAQPHPSTVFSKSHTLSPVALMSRTHVPLSSLDTLSPSGALPASRLFEAHVKILELEERMGNTPMVLVARLDDGKSIFVVERVEQNLYVLCKLGSWVNLSQLCAKAVVSRHDPLKVLTNRFETRSSLPGVDGESQVTPESSKYSKKKRLAIEAIQSMVKRPSKDVLSLPPDAATLCSQPGAAMEPQPVKQAKAEMIQEDVVVRPMATDILENIRSQYFEALYLSKVSPYFKARYHTYLRFNRHHWLILQKALYLELVQPSILIMTPHLT
jgi:DNA replication regulator SLD3